MKCPKCSGEMEEKQYERRISIQRCASCGGMFCRPEILERMKGEWRADTILDTGDPQLGKKFDKVEDIDCPECGTRMDKTSDPKQPHIWLETCPSCEGIFLDAGEFTDLKHDTLWDKVLDLWKGRRSSSA